MVLVLWEGLEEHGEKVVVVESCLVVVRDIVHVRIVGIGEPHSHRGLHCGRPEYRVGEKCLMQTKRGGSRTEDHVGDVGPGVVVVEELRQRNFIRRPAVKTAMRVLCFPQTHYTTVVLAVSLGLSWKPFYTSYILY